MNVCSIASLPVAIASLRSIAHTTAGPSIRKLPGIVFFSSLSLIDLSYFYDGPLFIGQWRIVRQI